jgi:hypothetical protein
MSIPLRRSPRLAAAALRRSPRLAMEAVVVQVQRRSPSAKVKKVIVPIPAEAPAAPLCTMSAHEASCAWCRAHPEWRQIKDNLTLMLVPFDKGTICGTPARAASALAMMSYISEVGVGFARAHKKFMDVLVDRCQHCIDRAGTEYPMLRLTCCDLIHKLKW